MTTIGKTGRLLVAAAAVLAAAGCGGSGGSSGGPSIRLPSGSSSGTPGGGGSATAWEPGVYAEASTYKDRCAAPRQGTDPDGNPWPDRAGSTTLENFWLRSWTEETYLWNDEVRDRDPNAYDSRLEYFQLMKTTAVTASGAPKDDFHFSQPTEEYYEQRNSVPTASYGVSFEIVSASPPRKILVRYADPGTPGAEIVDGRQQLPRGAEILTADGIDVRDGDDPDGLNDALFPRVAGEPHTFEILEPGASETRVVTLIPEMIARKPVNRTGIIGTETGKVGYILFNTFSPFEAEAEIIEAIRGMEAENVEDLVLDLRYNGGGLLAVASQLGYMVAGPAFTSGQFFETLRFNDDAGDINPVTGRRNDPVPFYSETLGFSTEVDQPLPTLDLPRVTILSTGRTCSASEAVINGLRGIGVEVVLIGGITCGKPYGFYPQDNCGETYYTIQFQGVNSRGFGDYADGFVPENASFAFGARVPGCALPDDFGADLGDPDEALLAAALQFRKDRSCPAAAPEALGFAAAAKARRDPALAVGRAPGLLDVNRDMRLPQGEL